MQKRDITTLILLISLVLITSLISTNFTGLVFVSIFILILSAFKFLAISFQFMELNKANSFWKILISTFLVLFVITIYLLLI